MKPVKLADDVYWVGGIDWNLRDFHGYTTQRGSTYNAYLIIDEKITLIDTVKHYLMDEMLERIRQIIDPAKIEVIVSNHVEMDHSGGLPRMKALAPEATLICSAAGAKGLEAHFKAGWDCHTVKAGDTYSIGKRELTFVTTPMVHWPDSMVTYSASDRILFSNDAFGQHIATPCRFDDECPLDIILEEAQKYYANIVLPYAGPVQKALSGLAGIEIEMIAPSHGIIWRSHIPEIMAKYTAWANNETVPKASIVYDTMWGSTEQIAYALQDGFSEAGIPSRMFSLRACHISDIMTDIITSQYICVGSPTLNNGMLPTASAFLTYMTGLKPQGRTGLAFGSYGWGGQSVAQIEEILTAGGMEILPAVKIKYIPGEDDLTGIRNELTKQLPS